VRKLFPNLDNLRHHRPTWLGGLELDIFIPALGLGIEYQGQQHFHAVELWGGAKGLVELQERDLRKRQICKQHKVRLVEIHYQDALTAPSIRSILGLANE